MHNIQYDNWNNIKKDISQKTKDINFNQKEIFMSYVGENIGFEQNGKGIDFMRPLLVFRKYSNNLFLGIPLSTTLRDGSFFFNFKFLEDKESCALLVQTKTFDAKRLDRKIGTINQNELQLLELKIKELMN